MASKKDATVVPVVVSTPPKGAAHNEAATPTKAESHDQPALASSSTSADEVKPVPYHQVFSKSDGWDKLAIFVAFVGSAAEGAALPLFSIFFGEFTDAFGNPDADFMDTVNSLALKFLWLGIGASVAAFLGNALFMWSGNRQTNRLRRLYLASILQQDIEYFDVHVTTGGLLQGLNQDATDVQAGISEKVGLTIKSLSTFVTGLIIAFVKGWDMTLVLIGCIPFMAVLGGMIATTIARSAAAQNVAYAEASSLAQQAIAQVRTVVSYAREEALQQRYAGALEAPLMSGIRQAWLQGAAFGGFQIIIYGVFAIALIYGAFRIIAGQYTGGDVMNVLFSVLMGSFAISQAAPNMQYIIRACTAAARLLRVIDRHPGVYDAPDALELPASDLRGEVELRDVTFAYPARPDVVVFRNMSLIMRAGKTTALVGGSGSGKSTIVSLVERFYDPLAGAVLLDGVDLRRLKLAWLRDQVGLVSQEPVLFATSIYENILLGRVDATPEEVESAAIAANAHGFIMQQPEGYNTAVGERGLKLSGGQKQRIAIARAILKNPRILLLDEATSALDTQSERLVQAALDQMVVGRTTVVVAHRLSTIKNADVIAVLQGGVVVEQGKHDELLANPNGAYSTLVALQMQHGNVAAIEGGEVIEGTSPAATRYGEEEGNTHLGATDAPAALAKYADSAIDQMNAASAAPAGASAFATMAATAPPAAEYSAAKDVEAGHEAVPPVAVGHTSGAAGPVSAGRQGSGPVSGGLLSRLGAAVGRAGSAALQQTIQHSAGPNSAATAGTGMGTPAQPVALGIPTPGAVASTAARLSLGLQQAHVSKTSLNPGSKAHMERGSAAAAAAELHRIQSRRMSRRGSAREGSPYHHQQQRSGGGFLKKALSLRESTKAGGSVKGPHASADPNHKLHDPGHGGHQEQREDEEEVKADTSFRRLAAMNAPEWKLGLMGCFGSAIAGAMSPAFGFLFSSMVGIFYTTDHGKLKRDASMYAGLMVMVGVVGCFAILMQQGCFGTMGQHLACRVRNLLFAAFLRQEIAWFDRAENSSGVLTAMLSTDAGHVRGAVGDVVGLTIQNLITLSAGYVIALIFDWRMALLVTGVMPLLLFAQIVQTNFMMGTTGAGDKMFATSNQAASEAITAIRVVSSYNMQPAIKDKYKHLILDVNTEMTKSSVSSGLAAAASAFVMFATYGLVIFFGGHEIKNGWTNFTDMLRAYMAILFAAMGLAQASAGFSDIGKAKGAVNRIFPIVDRKPKIDSSSDEGLVPPPSTIRGDLAFEGVRFAYPTRMAVTIFRDFCLEVKAGQTVALVGESGSGKSTVVGLVERFYDPQQGRVALDGVDVRAYNLRWLRRLVGLVSQEPLLFNGTILDNIKFANPDASMEEVVAAAAAANARDFVEAMPDQYNTKVGEGGIQLSGGQKQRVAIARAVLKNPKIMLLDEATSALDARSEAVVQEALDRIMVGRTSLVIAHRLSTIRGADVIAVVYRGSVLERGNHDSLMAANGAYARLVAAQGASAPPPPSGNGGK